MGTTNPALLLHERLEGWQNQASSAGPISDRQEHGRTWQEVHLETIRWAAEVKAHLETTSELNGHEAGGVVDGLIDSLLHGIFATEGGLRGDGAPRKFFSPEALMALKLVGLTWKTEEPNPEILSSLLEAAHKAQELAIAATHLSDDARHYLNQLTAHLIKAVGDAKILGTLDVRHLANELVGALAVYFPDGTKEEQEETQSLIQTLVQGVKNLFFRYALRALDAGADSAIRELLPPPQ